MLKLSLDHVAPTKLLAVKATADDCRDPFLATAAVGAKSAREAVQSDIAMRWVKTSSVFKLCRLDVFVR